MKFSELQIQQYDSHEYFLRIKLVVIKIRCIELLKFPLSGGFSK